MSLTVPKFEYLFQPFKAKDVRLYEALHNLGDTSVATVKEINSNEITNFNWELRFSLPGVLAVGTDKTDVWKRISLPYDSGNNPSVQTIQLAWVGVQVKVAPAASSLIVDLLLSKDKGVTFNSIFLPTNTNKIVLPIGFNFVKFANIFSTSTLQDGFIFRVDILQADGTVAAAEIILKGNLIRLTV